MTEPAESRLVRRAALRLGVYATLLASAIVVLLSAAAVAVVHRSQDGAATELLHAAVVRADDVVDPPAGVWLALQQPDGRLEVTPNAPAGLPDGAQMSAVAATGGPASGLVRIDGVHYRVDTVRHTDGTVVQGMLDLTANHAERNTLIGVLVGAGGLGLLLAAVAGTWLGHRALRPLTAVIGMQRRFVADAGHELRTPVTLLNTRAQLVRRKLQAGDVSAEARAGLDGIVADSARLGEVLEDLLIVADPAASRAREPVDLTAVVRSAVASAQIQAAEQRVRLTGPGAAEPPHYVEGSDVALRRAVTALLDNAVRHAGAEVAVTLAGHGTEVFAEVADDGPGVDPDLAPRLFERFASGRPVPGERRRRYGLGLALVSDIAAIHAGRVELLDTGGTGATFRLRLPVLGTRRGSPRNL